MSELVRMSFSIDKPLLDRLERLLKKSNYTNRSEFVRDMIREQLVRMEWDEDRETFGTVTLLYNHHRRQLTERLLHIQHHHHAIVLASTHVHLDRRLCAEVILMKGRASEIRSLANNLGKEKGVLHAALSLSSTGKGLA